MNESQNLIHALARAIPAATPDMARAEANRRYFKVCEFFSHLIPALRLFLLQDCFLAFNFPDNRDPNNPVNTQSWDPTNVIGKILAQ
jgi:hypothetical protein